MRVELPRMTVAAWIGAALCLVCGVIVESMLAHHPDSPPGAGAALAAALGLWLYRSTAHGSHGLQACTWLADGDWLLEYANGRRVAGRLGKGTRVVGNSLVLQWRAGGRTVTRWITSSDLDASVRRALTVRLMRTAGLRMV